MDHETPFTDFTWQALVAGLNREHEIWFEDEEDEAAPEGGADPRPPWEALDADEHLEAIAPTIIEIVEPHLVDLLTTGQLPHGVVQRLRDLGDGKIEPRLLEVLALARKAVSGDLATDAARPLIDQYRGYERRIWELLEIAIRLNATDIPALTASVFSRAARMYLAGFYAGALTFAMSALEAALASAHAGDGEAKISKLLPWACARELITPEQITVANNLVRHRNDVVHGGLDATAEHARMAIKLVGEVLTSLHEQRYT